MTTARILAAASLALAATATASSLALAATAGHSQAATPGGVGRVDHGAGPAGRSRLRDDSRSRFQGGTGDWGFAHHQIRREEAPGDWRERDRRRFGFYDLGFPYSSEGFDQSYPAYGPGGFGPEPPYGESFPARYPTFARPMAPALAPLAYGPGAHDGAYAYGYNGYAQTPPLNVGYGPDGWSSVIVRRP